MARVQAEVREFRRPQALAYPLPGMICLMVMAAAQGVVRGPEDLADYAQSLSQPQLRALKFRTNPHTGPVRCPGPTTFKRVLHRVNDDQVEGALLGWQDQSRLHHCLDITLQEDQSRVRTPGAARVLATIRRVVVSLANAAVNRARKKNPKTKRNTRSFQKRFRCARGGRERLHALVFGKSPSLLDLQN
jgi:hypothetical protein